MTIFHSSKYNMNFKRNDLKRMVWSGITSWWWCQVWLSCGSCHVMALTTLSPNAQLSFPVSSSFSISPSLTHGRNQRFPSSSSSSLRAQSDDTNLNENDLLSDTDAKVLQSLLNDNLDLTTEDRLRQMLARNDAAQQEKAQRAYQASPPTSDTKSTTTTTNSEDGFSSQLFQNLSSDSFWNSLRAKTNSLLESAQLFVQNRIERDAQLVAALGLFALDRIQKDVARALPSKSSSSKTTQRRTLTLGSNSSFNGTKTSPPSNQLLNANQQRRRELYQEFNTPADELRQVSESIKAIFSGDSTYSYAAASSLPNRSFNRTQLEQGPTNTLISNTNNYNNNNNPNNLRSVAPAGSTSNKERQKRALQKKRRQFEQEQQSNPQKVARSISDLTGTAYQLGKEIQTELQVEDPGYKTRNVRKALGEGTRSVQGFLEESGTKIWGSLKGSNRNLLSDNNNDDNNINNNDNINNDIDSDIDSDNREEDPINTDIPTTTTSTTITPNLLETEKRRLCQCIQSCLDNPSETWLRKDRVSISSSYLADLQINSNALGDTITAMVLALEELTNVPDFTDRNAMTMNTMDGMSMTREDATLWIASWETIVEELETSANRAAGGDAAMALRECLLMETQVLFQGQDVNVNMDVDVGVVSELELELEMEEEEDFMETIDLDRMEVVESIIDPEDARRSTPYFTNGSFVDVEMTPSIESTNDGNPFYFVETEDTLPNMDLSSASSMEEESDKGTSTNKRVMKVMDMDIDVEVERDIVPTPPPLTTTQEEEIEMEAPPMIELVGDDEEIMTLDVQAESIVELDEDDEYDNYDENGNKIPRKKQEEESVLVDVTLRSLDVAFFLAEKVITVGIPGSIEVSKRLASRIEQANRDGFGSKGWKKLDNVKDAKKRY